MKTKPMIESFLALQRNGSDSLQVESAGNVQQQNRENQETYKNRGHQNNTQSKIRKKHKYI
jgi:hypothetical protein